MSGVARTPSEWIRKGFPGFVRSLLPPGFPGPVLLRGASVCTLTLPGHLQNVDKTWIHTLAGFTETLVEPGSMCGSLLLLGYFALGSSPSVRQFSDGVG